MESEGIHNIWATIWDPEQVISYATTHEIQYRAVIMELINTEKVREVAEGLMGSLCHFILDTHNVPFGGGECIVYALEDSLKDRLSIRIPRAVLTDAAQMVENEVFFRKSMDREGVPYCQRLIGHDSSSHNTLQRPYIALQWTDGIQLEWSDTYPPDAEQRNKIIKAISEFNIALLRVQQRGLAPL